jgi:spoIIIJ-associated protein
MAAQSYEFTGKTVDEAIADGLKTLSLRHDQVDIEVLNKGSRGIFGIGSEPAQIRLILRTATPEPQAAEPAEIPSAPSTSATPHAAPSIDTQNEPAVKPGLEVEAVGPDNISLPAAASASTPMEADTTETDSLSDEALSTLAVDLLSTTLRLMGFQANVVASWKDADAQSGEYDERYLLLDVQGTDLGALIGRRGETLDNIQYLLRLMVNQQLRQWKNIVVDVEQYKARRVTQLTQLALRMADQVAASGRATALEPMPANERRIVHLALRDHPAVYTESNGEGERRKVTIVAKQ